MIICSCKVPYNNFKECDIHNPRDLESAKRTLVLLYEALESARGDYEHEAHSRSDSDQI